MNGGMAMMEVVRGWVRAYHSAGHTADVELARGPASQLSGLPVVSHCPAAFLAEGREVAVLLWEDVGGVVLGPYGAVADDWELAGKLTVQGTPLTARDLELAGQAVKATATLYKRYSSALGYKENAADNTPFDLVRFSSPGTGSGSVHRGVCSGVLTVTFTGRHTVSGTCESKSARYFITAYAHGGAALKCDIQAIGSANEETSHTVVLTVREKSGATKEELRLEAVVTHAYFDPNSNRTAWSYEVDSLATVAGNYITPTRC